MQLEIFDMRESKSYSAPLEAIAFLNKSCTLSHPVMSSLVKLTSNSVCKSAIVIINVREPQSLSVVNLVFGSTDSDGERSNRAENFSVNVSRLIIV